MIDHNICKSSFRLTGNQTCSLHEVVAMTDDYEQTLNAKMDETNHATFI